MSNPTWRDLLSRVAGKRELCNCGDALERHCKAHGCQSGQMSSQDFVARKVFKLLDPPAPQGAAPDALPTPVRVERVK